MAGTVHEYVQECGISDETIGIIIDKMATMLYERPQYYGFSGADELSEIFAQYWKRIIKAIKQYKYRGARFETYFIRTLQFLRINCSRSKLKILNYDNSIITDMMKDSSWCVMERTTEPDSFNNIVLCLKSAFSKQGAKNLHALRSRVEMLCLKCGLYIDLRELKLICKIAEIPETRIKHLIMLAQLEYSQKKIKYEKLTERRNILWLRMMNLEIKLNEQQDAFIRKDIAAKLANTRKHYQSAVVKIQNFKLDLSNSEVASLLKIPKPTVDSGLLRLQKLLKKSMVNKDMVNKTIVNKDTQHQPVLMH